MVNMYTDQYQQSSIESTLYGFSYGAITKTHRVTNLKGGSIQNQSTLVLSVRSTLGKIETTLQIGKILDKFSEIAILNHKRKYKKWLRDQNYTHGGQEY